MRRLLRDVLPVALFALALWLLPDLLRTGSGRASVSYLSLVTSGLGLAVLALSWDVLARTGQLSLAHAAFYGTGAYATAILAHHEVGPLWLGIPAGGLMAVLLALGLGAVTLRLRGIYFAIATLAFTEVVRAAVRNLPTSLAGGSAGLNVAPLFRPAFDPATMERWEIAFLRNEGYYLLYAGLLLVTIVISLIVRRSRLDPAFTAIRTNEEVAAVMGIDPARMKLLAFALSSVVVGMLGAVHAHRIGSVIPEGSFSIETTVFALVTPIFGGLYTTLGPIVGAGLLAGVEETLKRSLADGYLIGYGLVLVLSILFMPRGVVGLIRGLARRRTPPPPPPPTADAPAGDRR